MKAGRHTLRFGERTLIMGILNVTPDSFSDGGRFVDTDRAIERGVEMEREGADVIDVGGESTRPGASPVPEEAELRRVGAVIEGLARRVEVPISVDTYHAKVAREALDLGADIINDVTALRGDPEMANVVADSGRPVVLMHMLGEPRFMQRDPVYGDVVAEVRRFMEERVAAAAKAGVGPHQVIIDPGLGFGKTFEHNLELIKRLPELSRLGYPLLVGHSRKSFIGRLTGVNDADRRIAGTIAVGTMLVSNRADMLRVHDVREAVESAKVADALTRSVHGQD
ncbi:MAG: dihydropteroate synthase [Euryarchaeota archaeon]|nr:dihydropteroate synthase [Euryarchaeota archaeon]